MTTKSKRFKDPIYGYIDIPRDLAGHVVDSPEFQRLRRVTQTSYEPLYPSAVHNRFVHSLGVYHLGRLAMDALAEDGRNACSRLDLSWDRVREAFELACLLHDIGHAPFSHAGEQFFLDNSRSPAHLHEMLAKEVPSGDSESFLASLPSAPGSAAPHEIVSALVGLRKFGGQLPDEERVFFARCITGYLYPEDSADDSQRLRNSLIRLLNSKVIDVDKLDYLLRDAYTSGFQTVTIDYQRLLSSLMLVHDPKNARYETAFSKSAVSVIENMVFARDAERKWIQTHPVVLYETYLVRKMMEDLDRDVSGPTGRLFSVESLSLKGHVLGNERHLRLLCDDDIVSMAKSESSMSEWTTQYFDRRRRRRPLWKSEAEYAARILEPLRKEGILGVYSKLMAEIFPYVTQNGSGTIDDELLDAVERDVKLLESQASERRDCNESDSETLAVQTIGRKHVQTFLLVLHQASMNAHIPFDYVLLGTDEFRTGFESPDFAAIPVVFGAGGSRRVLRFPDVVATLRGDTARVVDPRDETIEVEGGVASSSNEIYYLYYGRKDGQAALSDEQVAGICDRIVDAVRLAADTSAQGV